MKLFKNEVKKKEAPTRAVPISRRLNKPIFTAKRTHVLPVDFELCSNKELRVAYFSTWKVSCGIAVYTEHLYNALIHQGVTAFAYPNTLTPDQLLSCINKDQINVLNIQYEPAIVYSSSVLLNVLKELKLRGVKVILTFHSESDSTPDLINVADQAIYHKQPSKDVDINKVNIIPMGVPVFSPKETRASLREKYKIQNDSIICSTTGFMFTWKKHASILEKVAPTLLKNKKMVIQLLTAFNSVNPQECMLEEKNIKNVISTYALDKQVIHITSFLSQQELSERLYLSDVGYLWGGLSTTSSSAASKEFISARLPLVVTESNHYHDLSSGIIRTPIDENKFVSILSSLDLNSIESLRLQQELNYNRLNNNSIILKHIEVFRK